MIGIAAPNKDITAWIEAIQANDAKIPVSIWPDLSADTRLLLCWDPAPGTFSKLPKLQAVCVMGAGTDSLESDPELPAELPLLRLKNAQLCKDMFYHVFHCAESWRLNMPLYRAQQNDRNWLPHAYRNRTEINVTVLGLGEIGAVVAEQLASEGYHVTGWSRTDKTINGVKCYSGQSGIIRAVAGSDVLVCLLPLKVETQSIINEAVLQSMAPSSCFINVARGAHVNEQALLAAMDNPIKTAFLDVFHNEPLAVDHPFWDRDDIVITPHIASLTDPQTAIMEVLGYYKQLSN